jgi:hypothetical protein
MEKKMNARTDIINYYKKSWDNQKPLENWQLERINSSIKEVTFYEVGSGNYSTTFQPITNQEWIGV